jgi:hypothetical protein
MTTKTLQECIPEAQRAYNRSCAKVLDCAGEKRIKKCSDCRLYLDCQLQSNMRQRKINLDELKHKTNGITEIVKG